MYKYTYKIKNMFEQLFKFIISKYSKQIHLKCHIDDKHVCLKEPSISSDEFPDFPVIII